MEETELEKFVTEKTKKKKKTHKIVRTIGATSIAIGSISVPKTHASCHIFLVQIAKIPAPVPMSKIFFK